MARAQVHDGHEHPRPMYRQRVRLARAIGLGIGAAVAAAGYDLVLGDPHGDRRQDQHLTAGHAVLRRARTLNSTRASAGPPHQCRRPDAPGRLCVRSARPMCAHPCCAATPVPVWPDHPSMATPTRTARPRKLPLKLGDSCILAHEVHPIPGDPIGLLSQQFEKLLIR